MREIFLHIMQSMAFVIERMNNMGLHKDEHHPNDAQIKRLYTIASNNGWTTDGIHNLIGANYGYRSTHELTIDEYNDVVRHVETTIVPNTVTMYRDTNTPDMFEGE